MALLVIDVQQGLVRKSTPIYRAEPLLNTLTTLIDRAHAAGVPVIYIQHASDKVLPFGSADWQLHPRFQHGDCMSRWATQGCESLSRLHEIGQILSEAFPC